MFVNLYSVIRHQVDDKGFPRKPEHKLELTEFDDLLCHGRRKIEKRKRELVREGKEVYVLQTFAPGRNPPNRADRRWFQKLARKMAGQMKAEAHREQKAMELATARTDAQGKQEDLSRTKSGVWLPSRRGSQRQGV